jgi:hypothetical protein
MQWMGRINDGVFDNKRQINERISTSHVSLLNHMSESKSMEVSHFNEANELLQYSKYKRKVRS